eukprot:9363904-Prorocentrum_lima.AAC.1
MEISRAVEESFATAGAIGPAGAASSAPEETRASAGAFGPVDAAAPMELENTLPPQGRLPLYSPTGDEE